MYKINVKTDKILNNKLYHTKLDNGLSVFVFPQKNFSKSIGMFGTKYGSIDRACNILDGKESKIPDGVAHFLEHKLFEQEEANALDLFSQIGMNANAYTSYDHTVYYFETTKEIEKGIKTLIKLVRTPYFTEQNVEKEKGIIAQEINMYNDEPGFQAYMTVLKELYKKHPISIDIAGSVDSIQNITKDTLYECYNNFYNLDNMFFIVVGDVVPEDVIKIINEELKKYKVNNNENIKKVEIKDEDKVEYKEINKKMNVYMPIITYGFKLKPKNGLESLKEKLVISIIESMYFSKLSKFYEEMYDKNIIDIPLDLSYESGKNYAILLLTAQTKEKEKIKICINNYLKEINTKKFDKELFENVKREKYGDLIYSYDNIDTFWREAIMQELFDIPVFSAIEMLNNITEEDIKKTLIEAFQNSDMVMSIID